MSTPGVNIQTDVVSYRKQVEKFSRLTGRGLKDVMQEGVAIMAGQLARRFPPSRKGLGQRAIKNDLSRIITTAMNKRELNNALKATGDNRYDPDGTRIANWHNDHRTGWKWGRKRPPTISGKDRLPNGWTASRKLHTTKANLNSYAKRRGEKVGYAKSHWAAATRKYKGAKELPAWITKHGYNGRVIDRMKDNGDGYIEIINDLTYASNWDYFNRKVVRSQSRMFSKKIRAEIKKQADRHNRRAA